MPQTIGPGTSGSRTKKVTAFIGTARRKATYQAVQEFEANLKRLMDVEFEYVVLDDYRLEYCRGCKLCINKDENLCPLKDDRDALLAKLAESDGVIFATPNYSFQVTARMKNFLDRLAFVFHRPRYFGKTFTAIVTQGFHGGETIRKYLEDLGETFGFQVTVGACVKTLEPMSVEQRATLSAEMKKAAERFHKGLTRSSAPRPSFFRLMIFRMTRTYIKTLDQSYGDYGYYQRNGWFESGYFYDVALGPAKSLAGALFDLMGNRLMARL